MVFCPSAARGVHDCSWQRSLQQRWAAKGGSAEVAGNVEAATALAEARGVQHMLVAGSLYLVGAALELVEWPVDDL